jgi:elongation factor Ts
MSAISAQDVNKLRQMTGAGMMDCKKALAEAEGDFDKAIEILRKKGQKVSASRSDRDAKEGSVFVKVSDDNKEAVLIALNCETDFVGKNEEFQALGKLIVETAFTNKPADKEALLSLKAGDLTINDKIVELVGKIGEKIEISEYIRMTGEAIVPYIHAGSKLGVLVSLKGVNGKDVVEAGKDVGMQIAAMNPLAINDGDELPEEAKLRGDEVVLIKQAFIKEPGKTIRDLVNETIGKTGENIVIRRFTRYELGV